MIWLTPPAPKKKYPFTQISDAHTYPIKYRVLPLLGQKVDPPDNILPITCVIFTNSGTEALQTYEETIKCARYQLIPMCVW